MRVTNAREGWKSMTAMYDYPYAIGHYCLFPESRFYRDEGSLSRLERLCLYWSLREKDVHVSTGIPRHACGAPREGRIEALDADSYIRIICMYS